MNISSVTSTLVLQIKDTVAILQIAITVTAQEAHILRKVAVDPIAMGTYMEMATTLIITMVHRINTLIAHAEQALQQKLPT